MTLHHFEPDHYHTTIGWHEPVLHVQPGDQIETTTVDAAGQDRSGEAITPRGNPMTGPFFVEGAEAGDTLVVTFDELTPNREFGWTRSMVAPNVVDPDYVLELPWPSDVSSGVVQWRIDNAAGTATLTGVESSLGEISLPLAPMVGCFGVAPSRGQAISTATSERFGGNMDYRGFAQGVRVYLPVSAPGALFHIGDGHALQGDGEIVGTGIEISFDVRFTLDLIKGKRIGWPRGENDDYIFTAGNARPMDQALQHATTEMLRWLQSDFGLDPLGASILMGQAVVYEVGNVYDPAYTMICKMPRNLLS